MGQCLSRSSRAPSVLHGMNSPLGNVVDNAAKRAVLSELSALDLEAPAWDDDPPLLPGLNENSGASILELEASTSETEAPLLPQLDDDVVKHVICYAISGIDQIPAMALVSKAVKEFVTSDEQLWLFLVRKHHIPALEKLWKFLDGRRSLYQLYRRRVTDRCQRQTVLRTANLARIPNFSLEDCAVFVEAYRSTKRSRVYPESAFLPEGNFAFKKGHELGRFVNRSSLELLLPECFHAEYIIGSRERDVMCPLGQVCFVHKDTADQAVLPYEVWIENHDFDWHEGEEAPEACFSGRAAGYFNLCLHYYDKGEGPDIIEHEASLDIFHSEAIAQLMIPG